MVLDFSTDMSQLLVDNGISPAIGGGEPFATYIEVEPNEPLNVITTGLSVGEIRDTLTSGDSVFFEFQYRVRAVDYLSARSKIDEIYNMLYDANKEHLYVDVFQINSNDYRNLSANGVPMLLNIDSSNKFVFVLNLTAISIQ